VDLVNIYLAHLGHPAVWANAASWAGAGRVPGWTWVANGPVNAPPAGAIVVWRPNVPALALGPFGHIAIALAADPDALLTLDQNWPVGAPVAPVLHIYGGVAGWHVPPR
jgi:hypothetical protein